MKEKDRRGRERVEYRDFEDFKKEMYKIPGAKERIEKAFAELNLAHQIIELREKAHMSQAELAKEINTKQQVVSRLEQEHHVPAFTTLLKLAHIFGKKLIIKFV